MPRPLRLLPLSLLLLVASCGGKDAATSTTSASGDALPGEPYRVFNQAGVTFRYPREFTYKADLSDPGAPDWKLTGRVLSVMVQLEPDFPDPGPSLQATLGMLRQSYGKRLLSEKPASLPVPGKPVEGVQLEISIDGKTVIQELYSMRVGKGTAVLILTDVPDQGRPSEERVACGKLLRESLQTSTK